MIFTDDFLEQLTNDPLGLWGEFYVIATKKLKEISFEISFNSSFRINENHDDFDVVFEVFYALKNLIVNSDPNLNLVLFLPSLEMVVPEYNRSSMKKAHANLLTLIKEINTYILQETNEARRLKIENRINLSMSRGVFVYEFSQGDLDRIQNLISELRTEISRSNLFEEKHKQRLLKRLEKLQSELHKKMSDLDIFWGLIGDAGVAIGKFGNDVKPIVDRIKEMADIIFQTQDGAKELPGGASVPVLED